MPSVFRKRATKAPTKTVQALSGTQSKSSITANQEDRVKLRAELEAKIRETLSAIPDIKGVVVDTATRTRLWGGPSYEKSLRTRKPPIIVNDNWPDSTYPLEYLEVGFISRLGGVAERYKLTYGDHLMGRRSGRELKSLASIPDRDIKPGMKVRILSGSVHRGSVATVVSGGNPTVKVEAGGKAFFLSATSCVVWDEPPKPTHKPKPLIDVISEQCVAYYRSSSSKLEELIMAPHTLSSLLKKYSSYSDAAQMVTFGLDDYKIITPTGELHLRASISKADVFSMEELKRLPANATKTDIIGENELFFLQDGITHRNIVYVNLDNEKVETADTPESVVHCEEPKPCLLYTSDAADESSRV